MGTAIGDLTAHHAAPGVLRVGVAVHRAICVPLAAWRLGANPVLTFWVAYVLTRPIGASFADYFGMPKSISGMGLGHGPCRVVTLILVVASFCYLSVSTRTEPRRPRAPPAPAPVPAGMPRGVPGNGYRPGPLRTPRRRSSACCTGKNLAQAASPA